MGVVGAGFGRNLCDKQEAEAIGERGVGRFHREAEAASSSSAPSSQSSSPPLRPLFRSFRPVSLCFTSTTITLT